MYSDAQYLIRSTDTAIFSQEYAVRLEGLLRLHLAWVETSIWFSVNQSATVSAVPSEAVRLTVTTGVSSLPGVT